MGCIPVDIDLEGNNCLGVKRAIDKWGPAELDKLGVEVDPTAA